MRQFFAGDKAHRHLFPRTHREVECELRHASEVRAVHRHGRLLREAEKHSLAINRMREKEPFRDHRLVRHSLHSIVNGRLQCIKVSKPDGLLLIRAGWIQILDHNSIFPEFIVKPPVAKKRERSRRTPDLLTGLLRAEKPVVPTLNTAEALEKIARREAAESPLSALTNFADCVARMLLSN